MQNQIKSKYKVSDWIILSFIAIAWGSADILAKKGLKIFSPNEVGIIRIFTASLFFLPIACYKIIPTLKDLKKTFNLILVGLLGSVLPAFLFARSQSKLDSWITTVFNSLTPIFVLILAKFIFNKSVSKKEVFAIAVGCIGTLILVSGLIGSIHGDIKYIIFPILGSLCYALATNLVSLYLNNENIFHATAISLMPYSFIMGILMFTQTDILYRLNYVEGAYTALYFIISVALLSSALAFLAFNILSRNTSPVFATMAKLIAPIISLMWGTLNGEILNSIHYIGILIILSGVYLLIKK